MFKQIMKIVLSVLLTSLIATSGIYAFTVTVPKLSEGDIVTHLHWNKIAENFEAVKAQFLNKSSITTCGAGQVSKYTGTQFICVEMTSGGNTTGNFLKNNQDDTMNGNLILGSGKEIRDADNSSYKINPSMKSSLNQVDAKSLCINGDCKTSWPTGGSNGGAQCPPRLTFTHDSSKNSDEYLSYYECSPNGSGELVFTHPILLDSNGHSGDKYFLYNSTSAAKRVCGEWGLEYVRSSLSAYDGYNRNMFTTNYSTYIPFKQTSSKNQTISTLVCKPGTVKNSY